jgi:purine-binding chemotaxis protein CheW
MEYAATLPRASAVPPGDIRQMVVFRLADRAFGIDVAGVREIRCWQPPTELPRSASHMLGVINLRGAIVPVLDVQAKLGFGANGAGPASVVVVADLGERLIGLLADAVSDIVDVLPGELQPAPVRCGDAALLHGLVMRDSEIIGLLNLAAIEGVEGRLA